MIPLHDFKRAPSVPLVPANVTRQRYPKVEQRTFQSLFISGLWPGRNLEVEISLLSPDGVEIYVDIRDIISGGHVKTVRC